MKVYRTKGGYFYKELKNGKKSRISKEQYEKQRKTQKSRKLVGGETNRNIQKNLKRLIYKAIYGKGNHVIFGSARENITNNTEIQNAKRQLINYYDRRKNLFNKIVNSHKSNRLFDKKTSNNRFRGKTYIQVIEDAATNSTNSVSQQRAIELMREFKKIDQIKQNAQNAIRRKLEEQRIIAEKRKLLQNPSIGKKCNRCNGKGTIIVGTEEYTYHSEGSYEHGINGEPSVTQRSVYGTCNKCKGVCYVEKDK